MGCEEPKSGTGMSTTYVHTIWYSTDGRIETPTCYV